MDSIRLHQSFQRIFSHLQSKTAGGTAPQLPCGIKKEIAWPRTGCLKAISDCMVIVYGARAFKTKFFCNSLYLRNIQVLW